MKDMQPEIRERESILIVDDDPDFRRVLGYYLGHDGFDVHMAESRKETFSILKKQVIDLILLDISMPEIDGVELLWELKRNVKTQGIPVFMCTGRKQIRDVERAFSAGAAEYVVKSVEAEMLGEEIKRKLRKISAKGIKAHRRIGFGLKALLGRIWQKKNLDERVNDILGNSD